MPEIKCNNCFRRVEDIGERCSGCGAPLSISRPKVIAAPAAQPVEAATPQACCPKCKSTSLHAAKQGFGAGKALVGAALTGGVGLLAGFIGAGKVQVTCLQCGNQWGVG